MALLPETTLEYLVNGKWINVLHKTLLCTYSTHLPRPTIPAYAIVDRNYIVF